MGIWSRSATRDFESESDRNSPWKLPENAGGPNVAHPGILELAQKPPNPDIARLRSRKDPIVQWPRTLPFHGGNTGSNPVRVACIHEGLQAILELA